MKVSFDFDDTLDQDGVWQYALQLIDRGVDVWVVTARLTDEEVEEEYGTVINGKMNIPFYAGNDDIYEMLEALGIPKDHIVFTSLGPKGNFFNENSDFEWHLDDAPKQLWDIRNKSSVTPISVLNPHWKEKCEDILRRADKQHYLKEWYIKDLEPYNYDYKDYGVFENPNNLAIGWLDDPNFPKGQTPPGFLEALKKIKSVNRHKGSHTCPFCGDAEGSAIHGIKQGKITYVYPSLLRHYIKEHNYLPPQEFIDVVMSGDFIEARPNPLRRGPRKIVIKRNR